MSMQGRLLAVMLGDDTDGTVRQSGGIRGNAEKRCGRKEQRQEKWLRKVIAMATCEERKDRIPEIKMLRTLLMVTDDSGGRGNVHVGQLIFTMSGSCTAHSCTFRARTQSRKFTKVLAVLERNEYTN